MKNILLKRNKIKNKLFNKSDINSFSNNKNFITKDYFHTELISFRESLSQEFDNKFKEQEIRLENKFDSKFKEQEIRLESKFKEAEVRLDDRLESKFKEAEVRLDDRLESKFKEAEVRLDDRLESKFKEIEVRLDDKISELGGEIIQFLGKQLESINQENRNTIALLEKEREDNKVTFIDGQRFQDGKILDLDNRLSFVENKLSIVN
jgi:hypothetical protein